VHGCPIDEIERRGRSEAAQAPVILPRALVAEDAPINQRVTVAMLEKLGFQADVVPNGREAIEQLGRARYGLILMDCRMPTMDGYEATAAIRQAEQAAGGSQRIPIIALTASAVLGVREGCIAAGMDDYLTKPLKRDELDRVLSRWVTPELAADAAIEQQPAQTAPADEAVPVLDPDNVAQLAELGADVLAELAGIFLSEAPELQHEIQQAVERADPVKLRFSAHRLRSEVRTWGAHRLDHVLERLEEIGDAGSADGAPELIPEMTEAVAEVVAALERLRHPDL
jgi:two-component system sensor histidine kinase/response regulator